MRKRVEIKNLDAICCNDNCDFKVGVLEDNSLIDYWHKHKCPKCGDTVLNDSDVVYLREYIRLVDEMNSTPMTEEELKEPLYRGTTKNVDGQVSCTIKPCE